MFSDRRAQTTKLHGVSMIDAAWSESRKGNDPKEAPPREIFGMGDP
jgi:hypothetical protein